MFRDQDITTLSYNLHIILLDASLNYWSRDLNVFYRGSIFVFYFDFGMIVIVFANGPEDLDSIPGRVMPKTQKWYLTPPCLTLSLIRYESMIKWSNPRKGVVLSTTPSCSSYLKGSLLVTLDYSGQLYLLNIHLYRLSEKLITWFQEGVPTRQYQLCRNGLFSWRLRHPKMGNAHEIRYFFATAAPECWFVGGLSQ